MRKSVSRLRGMVVCRSFFTNICVPNRKILASTKAVGSYLSTEEALILEQYCKQSEKTKTDVIRSYIRQLKRKVKKVSNS